MRRPFMKYFGAKFRMARHYPRPKYGRIIEPFAGSAGYSVYWNADSVELYDVNESLIAAWNYLIHVTEEEFRNLPDFEEGQRASELLCPPEVQYIASRWMPFGNDLGKDPYWNPTKSTLWALGKWPAVFWGQPLRDALASQLKEIRHWKAKVASWDSLEENPLATWFIDPPYQGHTSRVYAKNDDSLDFDALSTWCKDREGLTIVCERATATWLPFQELGRFQTGRVTKATYSKTPEGIYTQDTNKLDEIPWFVG